MKLLYLYFLVRSFSLSHRRSIKMLLAPYIICCIHYRIIIPVCNRMLFRRYPCLYWCQNLLILIDLLLDRPHLMLKHAFLIQPMRFVIEVEMALVQPLSNL